MRVRVLVAFGASMIAASAAACAKCPPSQSPALELAMPGPGPIARASASEENARCASCHAEAAASWRTSLHARAWQNSVFQGSFAKEPSPFCRDCHAPEPQARDIGIACVTCHDPQGTGDVLAVPHAGESRASPHRVVRNAAFGTERACAGCHDFAFPNVAERDHDGARMQRTISEHQASRFATVACATCHMPARANGSREHAFDVASNPAMLRRALVARATRKDDRALIDLAPGEVGHAVPTGDLFRRLVVVAEVIGADYQLMAHEERALSRRFELQTAASGAKVQREIADDRVSGPVHVELALGVPSQERSIRWRVEWQRVQSMHGDHAEIADTVVIAEGSLP